MSSFSWVSSSQVLGSLARSPCASAQTHGWPPRIHEVLRSRSTFADRPPGSGPRGLAVVVDPELNILQPAAPASRPQLVSPWLRRPRADGFLALSGPLLGGQTSPGDARRGIFPKGALLIRVQASIRPVLMLTGAYDDFPGF